MTGTWPLQAVIFLTLSLVTKVAAYAQATPDARSITVYQEAG
jgi:hypothetical protein